MRYHSHRENCLSPVIQATWGGKNCGMAGWHEEWTTGGVHDMRNARQEGWITWGMHAMIGAEHEECMTGGVQDIRNATHEGFMTWGMHDRRGAWHEECMTGGMHDRWGLGHEECTTGGIHDMRNACMTGEVQDMRNAWPEGWRIWVKLQMSMFTIFVFLPRKINTSFRFVFIKTKIVSFVSFDQDLNSFERFRFV